MDMEQSLQAVSNTLGKVNGNLSRLVLTASPIRSAFHLTQALL